MATDNVTISGPVKVVSDSKERVAFDLMTQISYTEDVAKDRKYYLTLYRQCWKATNGATIESILKQDS